MKLYKKLISFFLLIIFISIPMDASAYDAEKPIEGNKTFNINFNLDISKDYVNNNNFFISTDENGINRVEGVSVELDKANSKIVKVYAPKDSYRSGMNYYLFIYKG